MAREMEGGETSNLLSYIFLYQTGQNVYKLYRTPHNSQTLQNFPQLSDHMTSDKGVNLPELKGYTHIRNAADESAQKHQGVTK